MNIDLTAFDPIPETRALPDSAKRFEDGGQYRIEIPSVEGPLAAAAVVDAASRYDVPIHRMSQGSGTFMLTDDELANFARVGAEHGAEICLFARPTASWESGAAALAPSGALFAGACRGDAGLDAALRDIARACDAGIRSVLISDLGLLVLAAERRTRGDLPDDLRFKLSASFPVSNSATVALAAQLGADSVNVAGDAPIEHLASMRAVTDVPIDIYIESPAGNGGFVRHAEVAEIVRVAAPVYLKFGIRNAPDVYPSGLQFEDVNRTLAADRVRRARLALDELERAGGATVSTTSQGVPVLS